MSERVRVVRARLMRSSKKWELVEGRWRVKAGANPKAPDYLGTGELVVPGADPGLKVALSGWARKGQESGKPYLALEIELDPSEERRIALDGSATSAPADVPPDEDFGDIPF